MIICAPRRLPVGAEQDGNRFALETPEISVYPEHGRREEKSYSSQTDTTVALPRRSTDKRKADTESIGG